MTLEEVQTKMTGLGFKFQPNLRPLVYDTKVGTFYRRIETKRPCLTNDKDQFCVDLYDYTLMPTSAGLDLASVERFSLTAEIVGEYVPETWAKLNIYGLRPEKFFEQHENVLAALIRAWEALA